MRARAVELLDGVGLKLDVDLNVSEISAAERSLVAIARAMAVPTQVLVLDEPTAALPESAVAMLFDTLTKVRDDGVAILYVTHRLDEVFRIADRVTVLRDGRLVSSEPIAGTSPERLVHDIVGRRLSQLDVEMPEPRTDTILSLKDFTASGAGPVDVSLRSGEVLALVGLVGAGHHLIGRALFGDGPASGGKALLRGRPYQPRSSADAVRSGVAFVSSNRADESLANSLTVLENLYANPSARDRSPVRPLSHGQERRNALGALERLKVVPPDPSRVVATLSGGNQQKVVLARWLESDSGILILEEPTAGVDVGARSDVYSTIAKAVATGSAVLLVSSDFEEVARLAHRALVFNRGRVVAELGRVDISVARLTALASARMGVTHKGDDT